MVGYDTDGCFRREGSGGRDRKGRADRIGEGDVGLSVSDKSSRVLASVVDGSGAWMEGLVVVRTW